MIKFKQNLSTDPINTLDKYSKEKDEAEFRKIKSEKSLESKVDMLTNLVYELKSKVKELEKRERHNK